MHMSKIYLLQDLLTKNTYKYTYQDIYKDTYKDLLTKDILTSEFFFALCISQGYIQNFERNWRNRFAWESTILLSLHKEKNWNYQNLNTAPYVGKPEWGRESKKATSVISPEPYMPYL